MTIEMKKKLEALLQDPDEINAVFSGDPDQILTNFAKRGIEMNKEELSDLCSGIMDGMALTVNDELTEGDLEDVAGGIKIKGNYYGFISGCISGAKNQKSGNDGDRTQENCSWLYQAGYNFMSGRWLK